MDVLDYTIAKADLHAVRQQLEIIRDNIIRQKNPAHVDKVAEYSQMIKMISRSIQVFVNIDRENNHLSTNNYKLKRDNERFNREITELNEKNRNLINGI